MPWVASSARAPPRSRARVAATVAVRRTSETDAVPRSVSTTPMLAVIVSSRPPASIGSDSAAPMRSAIVERLGVGRDAGHEHGEVVAGEAPGGRVGGQHALQARADADEHLVAGAVAEAVVELAEAVEVDEQHRRVALLAARAIERLLEAVLEQRPVREARQRVLQPEPRDLLVGAPARDRGADDVRDRLREALVAGLDPVGVGRGDGEHADRRPAVALQRDGQHAAHARASSACPRWRSASAAPVSSSEPPASIVRCSIAACASPAGSPWPASGPSPIADSRRSPPSASTVSTTPRSASSPSTSVDEAGRAEVRGVQAGERALAERDDERLARDPLGALLLDELVVGDVADEARVRRVASRSSA